jgi:hypothetical protein
MEAKLDFLYMWIGTIDPILNVKLEDVETRSRIITVSGPEKSSPSRKMTIRLYISARKQLMVSADVEKSEEKNLLKYFSSDPSYLRNENGGTYLVNPGEHELDALAKLGSSAKIGQ